MTDVRLLLVLALSALLAGCVGFGNAGGGGSGSLDDDDSADGGDDDDEDDGTPEPTPEVLLCTPSAASVTYAYLEPATVSFDVDVEWSDGSVSDPEGTVTWTILDDFGGSITSEGVYTTPQTHGGALQVEAWWDGTTGLCEVDLFIEIEVDDVGDDTLDDVLTLTPPEVNDGCAPTIVYPLTDSMIPWDMPAPTFQWNNPYGSNLFVVTIENEYASATVTTTATSWRPDAGQWFALSDPTAGVSATMTVAGGLWDGATLTNLCVQSVPIEFAVGEFGTQSTVFYWSPSTSGLKKIDVGAESAEAWLGPDNAGYCVGCHSANLANASKLTTNFGGGNGWSVVVDVAEPIPTLIAPEQRIGNFMTLDPTGTRLVRSYQGTLYLDDVTNNVELGTLPTEYHATHPDWSPDGNRLVYASCNSADNGNDWVAFNCSIATLDYVGDSFTNHTVVVPAGENHYYYPSWSPDSQWIGFSQAPATGENTDSNDNPRGQIGIVAAAGGVPKLLSTASGGEGLTNSWPRWGPVEGDVGWIAFASRRLYGHTTGGEAQIWLAAVDLNVAPLSPDPSYAPIWLPGQDLGIGNHTPIWVPRYTGPD